VESHILRNLPVTVEEGYYNHMVLAVVAAGHNPREDHSFAHTVVEVNVMEDIRLGCSLQRDIQVEVSVFEEGSRRNRHLGAVGRRSRPGLDSRTLPLRTKDRSGAEAFVFNQGEGVGARKCR
jgi:hypothetical protein